MNENEVSDLPKKAYFGSLFLRRFFKYLLPLVLSLLLMTPLLAEAYRTTCDKSLETTQGYAEEALRQLEEQILASQELSCFFATMTVLSPITFPLMIFGQSIPVCWNTPR